MKTFLIYYLLFIYLLIYYLETTYNNVNSTAIFNKNFLMYVYIKIERRMKTGDNNYVLILITHLNQLLCE